MNYIRTGIIAGVVGVLAGCDYSYRYPCQDIENWDTDYCKAPYCEVHQECPEHVVLNFESIKGEK